ncbi:erythromycin esterase family protein [Streptomyces ipomoeae]|uniref:Erythromycin esterase n=2 Tax=Streptomyces ipomoeae TaxID=103232 RepID=L1KKC0_9ACTN|nr:erythromycin esterase family protein [Streptomyces ipomoeae]EKX60803.1 erythromycin esterase [Streptomyces ipomoeae 91-03]MDX2698081.1 erythromycin esterase family protein [Streptomyces ipomoeae]MDX2845660.1 erythromycin esterase family protein [Streptomyces ipomoeae]TQE19641.1 erythromycin esterase family protein [Streptomyces ipomoeae]TQE26486.1 erythromycin esterase family protein [Streptomyces ipomoeae]
MTQDIRTFLPPSCDLLGLGEPTHLEPAFAHIRNELFAQLVDHGFRSIALETDRVAALTVNDFVQGGTGDLDTVMSEGFSHGFGELAPNRRLIAWMRDHNETRPPEERLSFHGFDAPMETMSVPSPRPHLEHTRDYLKRADLGLDGSDLASLLGDDERWSRTEAVLDPAMSIGATPEADRLRTIADDLLTALHMYAPELIAATSQDEWSRAKTHATAALGLLRHHRQAAQRVPDTTRWTRLCATRDALMAQNLLDIRAIEARRGPTLVFSHNVHLQRNLSSMDMGHMHLVWSSAGAIVSALPGSHSYAFVAGSLGKSEAIALEAPAPDTYEGALQTRIPAWGLTTAIEVPPARSRTDATPQQGYFPLDRPTIDAADAILHINTGAAGAP